MATNDKFELPDESYSLSDTQDLLNIWKSMAYC